MPIRIRSPQARGCWEARKTARQGLSSGAMDLRSPDCETSYFWLWNLLLHSSQLIQPFYVVFGNNHYWRFFFFFLSQSRWNRNGFKKQPAQSTFQSWKIQRFQSRDPPPTREKAAFVNKFHAPSDTEALVYIQCHQCWTSTHPKKGACIPVLQFCWHLCARKGINQELQNISPCAATSADPVWKPRMLISEGSLLQHLWLRFTFLALLIHPGVVNHI